jgi:two-component system, NarL family, sensor histidine kinase UhpB
MFPEIAAHIEMGGLHRETERSMSLRMRLVALVGLVLLFSVACGSGLVAWRAMHSVRTELQAALVVGARTVRNGLANLTEADQPARELRRLVVTFDGNRHVRATLLNPQGDTIASSELFPPTQQVPQWFMHLIMHRPPAVHLAVPSGIGDGSAIILQADPVNEIGEVWGQSRDAMLVLTGFAALSALLISLVVGRALRSLETLSAAFEHVSKGDYHGWLPASGPSELMRLANGFNLMTQQLASAATQNQRLNERLLTLQAEERADLARDLHDEVGPLLFAVDMTAAAIKRLPANHADEISAHVSSIHDAVAQMQRHVRDILGRLRPIQAIDLHTAIDRLATFWRARRSDVVFNINVSIEEERIGSALRETIYRVVQEAVSNAIRHGNPTRIAITVEPDTDNGIQVEVTDDGTGMNGEVMSVGNRLGLIGMRERVMALAGSLSIQPTPTGKGLTLAVHLPAEDLLEDQQAGTQQ